MNFKSSNACEICFKQQSHSPVVILYIAVIEGEPHLIRVFKSSILFPSLPVCVHVGCSAVQSPIIQSVVSLIAICCEFDPAPILSMVILLLPLIQEGLLSVTSKSMCTAYWLTA